MGENKIEKQAVITANTVLRGCIVWLSPKDSDHESQERWESSLAKAQLMTEAEAKERLANLHEQKEGVIGVHSVIVQEKEGNIEPVTMKERIRAFGPSVKSGRTATDHREMDSGRVIREQSI